MAPHGIQLALEVEGITEMLFLETRTGWTIMGIDRAVSAQGKFLTDAADNFRKQVEATKTTYSDLGMDWRDHVGEASEVFRQAYRLGSLVKVVAHGKQLLGKQKPENGQHPN